MKKNIIKLLPFAILLAAGVAGCQKKLDINQNPNQPDDKAVTTEHILPNALHFTGVTNCQRIWLAVELDGLLVCFRFL